jgi:hypothetical protein
MTAQSDTFLLLKIQILSYHPSSTKQNHQYAACLPAHPTACLLVCLSVGRLVSRSVRQSVFWFLVTTVAGLLHHLMLNSSAS